MRKIFFLFLFIYGYSQNYNQSKIINLALKNNLYQNTTFKNLLFYRNSEFYIKDNKFYLSNKRDLKSELISDIKGFFKNKNQFKNINNHPQCRFPARFFFLKKELNISDNIFPKIKCLSFQEYKNKAPADKIYMVFTSANLKNPSSMMGHTFFKFEGKNYKNQKVNHAISFYTFINTINPFKLLYENTFSGMDGFFVLKPYRDILYNYLENENRNIWEYKLNLTNYQKKLIYYHIWELKDIKMRYYFTSFNCSTVDLFIVSLANPALLNDYKYYITPLDLMKIMKKHKLLKQGKLLPSDEWFIKLIEAQLNFSTIYEIKKYIQNKNIEKLSKFKNFYEKLLINVYSLYLFKKHKVSNTFLERISNKIKLNNENIDISKYKNPLKSPYQRQIGFSYFRDYDKQNYLAFNFLPASHTLNDDNREYFNESELKLGNFKLLANQNKLLLENFDIYSMTNLIPFDILIKPISYDFRLKLNRDYTQNLDKKLFFNTQIGIGEDFQPQNDINLFFLLNGKIRINDKTQFLINPKVGATIYTVGNGKLIFEYSKNYTYNSFIYDKLHVNYNILYKNFRVYYDFSIINNEKRTIEIGFSKYF